MKIEKDCELFIKTIELGFESEADRQEYFDNKIHHNKIHSRISAKARRNSKLSYCYFCKTKCSGFCKSHSIPEFVLTNIAKNGMVRYTLEGDVPTLDKPVGIARAGTFFLICNECDGKLFQNYEHPNIYTQPLSPMALGQIALKNYLLMISKRHSENALYSHLGNIHPNSRAFTDYRQEINQLDLMEYRTGCNRAMNAATNPNTSTYHLNYFRILNYRVPYAAQSIITLISDFEDNIINDIVNHSTNYKTKSFHLAVFPLKETTAIILFTDRQDKRYRKFFKQLDSLSPSDQLAAINYIVFAYTENVFLSPHISDSIIFDPAFRDVCRQYIDITASIPSSKDERQAVLVKRFSLSNRHSLPNLLDEKYSI